MRAGSLDRTITLQRSVSVIDDYGSPAETWADVVTLRAQKIQSSTEEYIRDSGASDETTIIFRTRWVDGVTNADRLIFEGVIHNIKEIKELGRQDGIEFRTHSFGQAS